jgi:hypothetical protein
VLAFEQLLLLDRTDHADDVQPRRIGPRLGECVRSAQLWLVDAAADRIRVWPEPLRQAFVNDELSQGSSKARRSSLMTAGSSRSASRDLDVSVGASPVPADGHANADRSIHAISGRATSAWFF